MKQCTDWGHRTSYRLSDGRCKCHACSKRYSVRSVWAASQLPATLKSRLVEMFALGVPVYRQRFRQDTSSAARERFYRVPRACCAHAEELREPFTGAIECDQSVFGGYRKGKCSWGASGKVLQTGDRAAQRPGQSFPDPGAQGRGSHQPGLRAHHPRQSLLHRRLAGLCQPSGARWPYRGAQEKSRPKGRDHINGIEGFWSYAKNWLYPYRSVPRKYFHLCLGEICYRFNHRKQDLKPSLQTLQRKTAVTDIQPILVRLGKELPKIMGCLRKTARVSLPNWTVGE